MTEQGVQAARPWQETGFATEWVAADTVQELLTFPRAVAAALVKQDRPQATRFVDIGSGTGEFLRVFLEEFPDATGLCTDASEEMLEIAREKLAPFGDRVDYRMVDMTDLSGVDPAVDVLMTSRAAHHLDRAGLHDFYAQAQAHLAPGGWLINLDHIGPKDDDWDALMRAVRKRFQPPTRESKPHHHNYPLTGISDHTDAFTAAGLPDHEIAWRGLISCLFVARNR